ncbi:MAG: discoidin domain-containing protein [Micromonosporaceae bacterium]
MQASALGRYLLYDRGMKLLAAGLFDSVVALPRIDASGDWQVDVSGDAYTLTSTQVGKALAVAPWTGLLRVTDVNRAGSFRFEKTTGCAVFPEAEVNATGAPLSGGTATGEVRGLLDMHLHAMHSEALGGGVICGAPFHPQGITKAVVDCPDHEPAGLGGWFENVVTGAYGPTGAHDTRGWADVRRLPQGQLGDPPADVLQVDRTGLAGRAAGGDGAARLQPGAVPGVPGQAQPVRRDGHYPAAGRQDVPVAGLRRRPVEGTRQRLAADRTRPVRGPPGGREGKLAVVLGIETSEIFGCTTWNGAPQCTRDDIDSGLEEMWALGIRHMQLINKFDNALGGVRFDSGTAGIAVNGANFLTTGKFWQAETCTTREHDNEIANPDPSGLIGTPLQDLLPGTLPVYPPAPHCNKLGLTELGGYAIRAMAARGIVVDLDHLSVKATDGALDVIESLRYPGVVSGHSWLDPHFYSRIYQAGGLVTLYGFQSPHFAQEWAKTKAMHDADHYFGFGFGSDANGIATQPVARPDAAHNHPVQYPFRSFDGGTTLDRQRTGERVYDINRDGVAHYGLRPDWIEDLRLVAGPEIVDDMSKGAEAYLRMWASAERWEAA